MARSGRGYNDRFGLPFQSDIGAERLGIHDLVEDAADERGLFFEIFANTAGVFRLEPEFQARISLTICRVSPKVISEPQHLNGCRVPVDANVEFVGPNVFFVALEEQMIRRQIATAPEPARRQRRDPGIDARHVGYDRKNVDLRLCRQTKDRRAAHVVEIDQHAAEDRPEPRGGLGIHRRPTVVIRGKDAGQWHLIRTVKQPFANVRNR